MSRPLQKTTHPQRLSALHRHQPTMPQDVIFRLQIRQRQLIMVGIPLQARNSLFQRLTETRADLVDFKMFLRVVHFWLQKSQMNKNWQTLPTFSHETIKVSAT